MIIRIELFSDAKFVIWSDFEKVSQSNCRFDAMDTLAVTVNSVKMPVCCDCAMKSIG